MFEAYYKVWRESIRTMAQRLAFGDRDLADDLEQEALCGLAAFDVDAVTTNEAACIRTMLYRRMCNVRRSEKRASRHLGEGDGPRRYQRRQPGSEGGASDTVDSPQAGADALAMLRHGQARREERVSGVTMQPRRRVPRHRGAAPWSDEW
jgi:hypothetical protein